MRYQLETAGTIAAAGAAVTTDPIVGNFIGAAVQVVCPTGAVGSIDYTVYSSVRQKPDADDWATEGFGTLAPGAAAIVDFPVIKGLRRNIRVKVERSGGAAVATAYRVYMLGQDASGNKMTGFSS